MSKPVVLIDAGELVGLPGAADGDVLTWNGTTESWQSSPGGGVGTVTSVALSTGSTGLTVSGGTSQTITGAGTFTLGGTLGAGYGGTGLGAPVSGDVGKVLTATSGGSYTLSTPAATGVTSITAGAGLDGGVITSTGTISMPNVGTAGTYGNVAQTPFITTDAQGRVTSVSLQDIAVAQSQVTGLVSALSGKVSTTTQVLAGMGLAGGGALSANVTLSLATVGTAQTALGSASKTVTITTDAYGRVTSLSEQNIAIDGSAITSGTVALANGGTGQDLSGITAGEVIVGQTGGGSVDAVTIWKDATLGADGALTVVGLQGRPLSSSAPIAGQSLVWSTAGGGSWVPGDTASGGSGGGGVVYFMNAGASRSGGGLPAGSYQLGRAAQVSSTPITITNVPTSAWTRIAGFVTDAGDPTIGQLPAGIWDFNVYATSTANADDMLFRLSFYQYDGSTDPELGSPIATTLSTAIYDPSSPVQYQATFNIPQTPFAGKRIYLKLEAFTSANNKNVTFDFGNSYASHVHTTVPSVTGSGFVKVLNDVIVSTGQHINLADAADVGTSVLGVANGGTGASSLTQHAVLVGNGTSAVTPYGLTDGQVLIGQTGGAPAAASLTAGTGVSITGGHNSIEVAIGQAVGTSDSPTFAGVTATGLTASRYVKTNSSKQLVSSPTIAAADLSGIVAVSNGGTGAATTSQRYAFIGPTSGSGTPDFRALVAADISDLASGSVTSIAGTTNQVIASGSTGAVTLSLPQSIGTSSSPTFAGLSLSGLTGYLKGNGGSALSASSTIPTSDLSGTIALGSQVSGTLPVQNGGTGATSFPTGAILVGQGTGNSGVGFLQGTVAGQIIQWNALFGWQPVNSLGAAYGGTGLTSYTAGDILFASGSSTLAKRGIGAAGTVLTSNGTSPQWLAPAASGTVTSVTSSTTLSGLTLLTTDGTSTPAISLTGTLGVPSGGTGATTLTQYGVLVGNGTSAVSATSAGSSGQYLKSGAGSAAPSFATIAASEISGLSGTYAPLASPTFTGTPAAPTASAGTNTTQLATTAFVTAAVAAAAGTPYDVSGEAAGTLALNDEIWHFEAVRAFTVSATSTNHKAGAVTAPSGTCVITIYKNNTSTQVFTITYTASATGLIGGVTNGNVAVGDVLFAKITSGPSTISNPYWTLFGTI